MAIDLGPKDVEGPVDILLERNQAQAEFDGFLHTLQCLHVDCAQPFDQPFSVYCTYLIQQSDRRDRQASARTRGKKDVHGVKGKPKSGGNRGDDSYVGQAIRNVVLNDDRRSSLSDFPAYCRVERCEEDLPTLREAGLRCFSDSSSRCHIS